MGSPFNDLVTSPGGTPANAPTVEVPDFSDLAKPLPKAAQPPSLVYNPGATLGAGVNTDIDPARESKMLSYEAARGASFGLSDPLVKWANPGFAKETEQFENQRPLESAGAQLVGGFAPGLVAPEVGIPGLGKNASTAARILGNTGFGAVVGGVSGAANSEDHPYRDAALGAGVGATLGAGIGGISGNIGPVVRKIVTMGTSDYTGDKAAQMIAQKIATDADAGHPGAAALADVLDRMHQQGSPLGIMDVAQPGGELQGMAGNLYRTPGTRATISNYFTTRDGDATGRLLDAIDNSVATGSKTADEAVHEQSLLRSQSAQPLYDQLFSQYPVVSSDKLDQYLADPDMQKALQRGMSLQRREALGQGTPFDPNAYTVDWNAAGDPVWKGTPNLRTWDAAKQGLDAIINGEKVNGRLTPDGRSYLIMKQGLVNELDQLTSGSYAQARAAWGGPSQAMDMITDGQNWRQEAPTALSRKVAAMSPNDRDFFLLGVADDMRQRILTTSGGDESKRVLSNPNVLKQAQAVFDPGVYQQLADKVLAERQAFQTYTDVAKGSQTAGRAAEDKAAGHAPGSMSGLAVPLLLEIAQHNPELAASFAGMKGLGGLMRWARTPSAAIQQEAARALTLPPDEGASYLRNIAGITAGRAPFTQSVLPGVAGIAARAPGEFLRQPVTQQARGGII